MSMPADVDVVAIDCGTLLHNAVEQGSEDLVAHLLQSGADVEAKTQSGGCSLLHLAAAAGHAHLLPLLITPATLNQTDATHLTALQLAVKHHHWDAAAVLVAAGASPRSAAGDPLPLWWALKMLPHAGAANTAALLVGAMQRDPSCATLLAAAVRYSNAFGKTALMLAARHGSKQLVVKLVEAGADKDAVDSDGYSPLATAVAAGHVQLVPLLATPRNINRPVVTNSCTTALHYAAYKGERRMVEALLAAGAVTDMLDGHGCSAVVYAARYGHMEVAALLLAALAKRWGNKDAKARGVALVAAAVVAVASDTEYVPRCAQLLGVVLDVLGQGVAGEVCSVVQHQLREGWKQHPEGQRGTAPPAGHNHLAEALLLGWLETEERLHAARQPLVARLQRLVPGVGSGDWQLDQGEQQRQQQQQQQQQTDAIVQEQQLQQQATLVVEAELAAAAGEQQQALQMLQQVAALHLRQQPCGTGMRWGVFRTSLVRAVHTWLGQLPADIDPAEAKAVGQRARLFRPSRVYTTLLAARVAARRQLQQLPREVAGTVVAAMQAAQQQLLRQQQRQEQQQLRRRRRKAMEEAAWVAGACAVAAHVSRLVLVAAASALVKWQHGRAKRKAHANSL